MNKFFGTVSGSRLTKVGVVAALVLGGVFIFSAHAWAATIWTVDPATTSTCIVADPNCTTAQSAVDAASDGDTVMFSSDTTISHQITVNKALTIDGGSHILHAVFAKTDNSNNSAIGITHSDVTIQNLSEDGTGGTNLHGINVYVSTGVNLNNVTISNNGHAGVIVNGSDVTATNLNTSNNVWGAVNVDPGSVVITPSVFTLNSGNLSESTQIWSDGANVGGTATVTVNASGYNMYAVSGQPMLFIWSNRPSANAATITRGATTTIYSSIQAAIAAALSGETVNVGVGTYKESLLVNQSLSIVGVGATKPVITGTSTANYAIKVNGTNSVTLDNLEINGGGTGVGGNTLNYGIWVNNSGTVGNPVEIKNSTIKNVWVNGANGIGVESSTTSSPSYALVHDNTLSSFHKNGIRIIKSNGKVYANTITGDSVDGTSRVQNLVNIRGGSNVEVYGNTLTNALTNPLVIPTWDSTGILVSAYLDSVPYIDSHADIHNNDISFSDSGIVITSAYADPDNSSATILNNNLHNLNWAINFEKDTAAATIHGNKFSVFNKALHAEGFATTTGPSVNAESNWWGSINPDFANIVTTSTDFTPWCTDSACNQSIAITTTTASTALGTTTVGLPNGATASSTPSFVIVGTSTLGVGSDGSTVTFNDGTEASASGPFDLNSFISQITLHLDGSVNSLNQVVVAQIGVPGTALTFSQPVTIRIFVGSGITEGATLYVFLSEDGTNWTTNGLVNSTCIVSGGFCTFQTTQASSFGIQTYPAPRLIGGGGGGGGGGGAAPATPATPANPQTGAPAAPATPATPPVGQVLGASTVRFTRHLGLGSKGDDVTNLQQILASLGFFHESPTGYFGLVTLAAVEDYQKAHGINDTGFVGPLTLASLNGENGAVAGASIDTAAIQAQITALQAQIQRLMDQIKALQNK